MRKIFLLLIFCLFINSFNCLGVEELKNQSDSSHQQQDFKKETVNSTLEAKINSDIEDEMKSKRLELAKQKQENGKNKTDELKESPKSLLYTVLMYIPNRVIDLTDIFSVELGFGPEASIELTLTKYCQFSAAYGDRYFVEKGYNRQYGGGYYSGYSTSALCWSKETSFTDFTFGGVEPYIVMENDFDISCPCKKPYSDGIRDFWKIGFHAGWIVDIGASIHPIAIANFVTGFFFIRLTDTKEM